jgi:hypothetical protein
LAGKSESLEWCMTEWGRDRAQARHTLRVKSLKFHQSYHQPTEVKITFVSWI